MQTINEQMADALHYEETLLAHALLLGIQKGYWTGDDRKADFGKLDMDELLAMREKNVLGIRFIHLYSSPLGDGEFAMIFAANEKDVREVFQEKMKRPCEKMHRLDYGLDQSFYDPNTKKFRYWREYRSTFNKFPAFACIYRKE